MRLYVTPKGRWAGTQADARVLGREDGDWLHREVPTDKDGLLSFLNEHRVGAAIPLATPAAPTPPPSEARPDNRSRYQSPLSAEITLQRIDGAMIASAIRQMTSGKALADVLAALVERLQELQVDAAA